MRCTILLVCEHEDRISMLDSTLDSTLDLRLVILVTNLLDVKLLRNSGISRLCRIWVIHIDTARIYPSCILEVEEWVRGSISLNHNSLVLTVERFVAVHHSIKFVSTRSEVREIEQTVVVLVNGISSDLLTSLGREGNHSAIERSVLIVGVSSILIEFVCERLVLIFHSTEDITLGLRICLEVINYTTEITDTLLLAVVLVERTVASWLVGMEVTLYKETRNTMVEYTEVTGIGFTCRWESSIITASVEIDIRQNMLRCLWIAGIVVGRLKTVHRATLKSVIPRSFTHIYCTRNNVCTIGVTTIEV